MSITSVVNDLVTSVSVINALKPLPPTISGYSVGGVDDTALDPAGGQTVQINGTGFLAGATITFDGSAVAVVTYVNPNQLTFTSPAKTAGTYTIYAVNPDGGTAIFIPGIIYSVLPTWTTSAGSLGSYYETTSISNTVIATGDAPITYSLFSGSLPTGSTLYANGVITGTAPVDSSSTTYSFTIQATDAQLQDSTRSFSLTINVDAVTWVSPANATTYSSAVDSAIANVALSATDAAGYNVSYSANALPTGLSLSGANISGTPTVIADSSTLLTATAATTNRSATRTINWSITVANDVYFEYNTLLIPGASTTFVDDASTNNFAVTIFGDTKPNNFNPYTPGYYSNYFDGTGDYLSVPDNVAFTMGAGDFTLECWVNLSSVAQQIFIGTCNAAGSQGSMSFVLGLNGSSYPQIGVGYAGSMYVSTFGTVLATNRWYHIAGVRNGANVNVYVNGVQGPLLNMGALAITDSTEIVAVGRNGAGNFEYVTGYISNVRIVKGTAVYTANFTPPTTPLTAISGTSLLTCQSNRFIDNSANAFTVTVGGNTTVNSFDPFTPNSNYSTYGSGYFDGTGDYLSIPSNSALQLPTGDFTIEAWIYLTGALGSYYFIFTQTGATNATSNWDFIVNGNASGQLRFEAFSGGTQIINLIGTSSVPVNAWTHVAVTRSGSTYTIWMNGISQGTASSASTVNSNAITTYIGENNNNTYYFPGYITDVRIVKGTAVYTTAFTPPTAPLTAIANTSLLVLQNNQSVNNSVFLDNSTNNFFVTRAGNTTQGTFSPYGGNWSNYFTGAATSYIQTPAGSTTAILGTVGGGITPTATFTIECWIYQIQRQTALVNPVLIGDQGVNGSLYWTFGPDSSGKLAFYHYTGTTLSATGNDTIPLNTWTHIAVSISSGLIKLFVNGNLQTITGTSTTGTQSGTFGYLLTGGFYNFTSTHAYIGNLSNLRIVKSALYSTTFTPSTTPLTPITNTGLLMCQSSRFIDNSPNAFALTTGSTLSVQRFSPFNPSSLTPTSYSGYFDGTGDYLTWSGTTVGTGAMTFECWFYYTGSFSGISSFIGPGSAITGGLNCYINNSTSFAFDAYGVTATLFTVPTITANTWNHVAFVRNSSNVATVFFNGVRSSTGTLSDTYSYTTSAAIGYVGGVVPRNWIGYISNARLVVGSNVYDPAQSTITVPTTPLTAVSGTSLLTCQSPTFIDNSTNNFTITAVGNSQPTQQNPFGFTNTTTSGYTPSTIGGSGYFDGTDYLSNGPYTGQSMFTPSYSTAQNVSATIEFWIYPTTTGAGRPYSYTTSSVGAGADIGMFCYLHGSAQSYNVQFGWYNQGTSYVVTGGAALPNAWTHVAFTYNPSGGVGTLYVNGVSVGTPVSGGNVNGGPPNSITNAYNYIGVYSPGSSPSYFTGYISDFRYTTNSILYTGNFVPPAAPLTATNTTSLLLNMTSAGVYDAAMMNNMESVADAKLSTAVSKFGGSSMYFDGTGDYLLIPSTQFQNFAFGTGDFTIECWLYQTAFSADMVIAASFFGWATSVNFYFATRAGTPNILIFRGGDSVPITLNGNTGITTSTWTHVAVCRASGVTRMFVGGVAQTATHTGSVNLSSTIQPVGIGAANNGSEPMNGYLDDLRITKGYARYTTTFTPPTSAFPIY